MKNKIKNLKIERKIYWSITVFTLVFLILVWNNLKSINHTITTGQLDTWLTIAGGVVGLFTVIAFLNMYIGKEDFRILEERLIKQSDDNLSMIKNELLISTELLNSMVIRMDKYQAVMDNNTQFIMDYTQYLSNHTWYYADLSNKFINHYKNNNFTRLSCAAIIDISEKTINQALTDGSGTVHLATLQNLLEYSLRYLEISTVSEDYITPGFWGVNLYPICDYLKRILTNFEDYRDELYNYSKIFTLLDQLRIHYSRDFQFNELDKNPLEYVDSDFFYYKELLEIQIDFQIKLGYYGFVDLIKDLDACLTYQLSHLEHSDYTPFGDKETISKKYEEFKTKYKVT